SIWWRSAVAIWCFVPPGGTLRGVRDARRCSGVPMPFPPCFLALTNVDANHLIRYQVGRTKAAIRERFFEPLRLLYVSATDLPARQRLRGSTADRLKPIRAVTQEPTWRLVCSRSTTPTPCSSQPAT